MQLHTDPSLSATACAAGPKHLLREMLLVDHDQWPSMSVELVQTSTTHTNPLLRLAYKIKSIRDGF